MLELKPLLNGTNPARVKNGILNTISNLKINLALLKKKYVKNVEKPMKEFITVTIVSAQTLVSQHGEEINI
jgi:hypothetical protein